MYKSIDAPDVKRVANTRPPFHPMDEQIRNAKNGLNSKLTIVNAIIIHLDNVL